MSELHLAYLSLGSNIQPEINLVRAVKLLSEYGKIEGISSVWETEAVGTEGPNYLNACAAFASAHSQVELKRKVVQTIELQLGRKRTSNKFAPRSMDIDIVIFDGRLVDPSYWDLAYVMVPLAELHPGYRNPSTGETAGERAARLREKTWLERRRGLIGGDPASA